VLVVQLKEANMKASIRKSESDIRIYTERTTSDGELKTMVLEIRTTSLGIRYRVHRRTRKGQLDIIEESSGIEFMLDALRSLVDVFGAHFDAPAKSENPFYLFDETGQIVLCAAPTGNVFWKADGYLRIIGDVPYANHALRALAEKGVFQ
jgi:hypothetical protein